MPVISLKPFYLNNKKKNPPPLTNTVSEASFPSPAIHTSANIRGFKVFLIYLHISYSCQVARKAITTLDFT